ncbi:UNVERIFIED_CONTAM: hypothetical protein K2H54_017928 [Gekko kuhli]
MAPRAHAVIPEETAGGQDIPCPDRLFRRTKKRLGILIRFLLAFVPSRLQRVCGYFLADTIAGKLIPEEIKEMLINPSCQDSQRNQANLTQEEKQCWVEAIQGIQPDEDDPEDSTYEPTTSEYESDDYNSQNDTEVDLETEEKDGVVALKEQPNQQDELRGHAEPQELEEKELHSPGDGSEHPGNTAASSSGQGQASGSQEGMATQIQEGVECRPAPEGHDTSLSSDSQEQWVDLSATILSEAAGKTKITSGVCDGTIGGLAAALLSSPAAPKPETWSKSISVWSRQTYKQCSCGQVETTLR